MRIKLNIYTKEYDTIERKVGFIGDVITYEMKGLEHDVDHPENVENAEVSFMVIKGKKAAINKFLKFLVNALLEDNANVFDFVEII